MINIPEPIRVEISNDPLTGFKRQLTYDIYLLQSQRSITVRCIVDSLDGQGNVINNSRVSSYMRELVASDNLVNNQTGEKYTQPELALMDEEEQENNCAYEYDFFMAVLKGGQIDLMALASSVIHQRDLQGKFD